MERSSALYQRHTSPGYDAHPHEFPGLYRTLMKASGVDILTSAAFTGITSQRKCLRAYSLIIAVLLQNFYWNGAKTYEELIVYLQTAREHPTWRLWVERNGDFRLQQHCLKAKRPYFFVAGHHNYARYLSLYVRQMEHLAQRAKEDLQAGAHSDGGPQCQISSESRHISSD